MMFFCRRTASGAVIPKPWAPLAMRHRSLKTDTNFSCGVRRRAPRAPFSPCLSPTPRKPGCKSPQSQADFEVSFRRVHAAAPLKHEEAGSRGGNHCSFRQSGNEICKPMGKPHSSWACGDARRICATSLAARERRRVCLVSAHRSITDTQPGVPQALPR